MRITATWQNVFAIVFFCSLCVLKHSDAAEIGFETFSNPGTDDHSGFSVEPAVIGGECVKKHELPWIVSISYPNDDDGNFTHLCGGSIIHKRLILTAAHCLFVPETNDKLDESKIRIRGGSHRPHKSNMVGINYVVILPNFNNVPSEKRDLPVQDDLAILRIRRPLKFSDTVQPITLPSPNQVVDPKTPAYVAGWGYTQTNKQANSSNKKIPNCLQKAAVNIISNAQCATKLSRFTVTNKMICTNSTVTDICQGDSGGALYKKILNGGTIQYQILGIISASSKGCGAMNGASVFTRVTNYLDNLILKAIAQCNGPIGCDS